MNRTGLFAATLSVALLAPAGQTPRATGSSATVVFEWNQILQDSFPTQGVGTVRPFSMTHIAMFDAVNAIEREYEPYHARPRSSDGGSPEAAAAQAAHDVLVGLNPSAATTYDAALARQLGNRPSSFVRRGAAVGARVAKEILAWRQNDGWIVSPLPPPPVEPPFPGRYQRTAPNFPTPTFTHLQNAAPMALLTSTQFLPPPPPMITSERYAADFNEVKLLGKSDSTSRTPEQTMIARMWAGVGAGGAGTSTNFLSVLNNIVRDVTRDRRLSLVATARVFVLVNVSIHDALHHTQTSKFVYGFWRPVTAIQQAADDLNDATAPDPSWLPLITTPPYPSYAGNIATIGASAARALQLVFRTNDIPVRAIWRQSSGQPDVVREFAGFWEVADDMYMARIWSGIHYRFDQDAGQQVARSVAEYVSANYMTRRSRWND
jgi:hypothetical protein